MTDIKHDLDSAEPCIESNIDKESGAGANAASAAEMVLITSSPLSELIWTPQEGLSLKYTDSSKAERNASFLWKAESLNMIISTSQCTNGGECSTSGDHIAGESIVQSNHNSDKHADGVVFLGSPRRLVDRQPTSLTRLHGQYSMTGSYGNMKSAKDMDEADLDLNQSVKNDVDSYSSRNIGCLETICPAKDVIHNIQNKIFSAGPRPDLAETKAGKGFATTDGTSNGHLTETVRIPEYQKSGLIGVSDSHDSMSAKSEKSVSSMGSTECKHDDLALGDAKEDNIRKPKNLACFQVHGSQQSCGLQSKNVECQSKDGMAVALLSQDVGKDETGHANIQNETAGYRFQSAYNVSPGKLEKGKEKMSFDDEDYDSSSKEQEDSNESVESSNSQRLISKGKRAFGFDLKISERCKKIKRDSNESSCSGSLIRKDSSFANWISTISSSFSSYDQPMTSLVLLPQSYNSIKENFGSLQMSQEKTGGVMSRTAGFNSFFQALYCPKIMVPNAKTDDDHRRGASTSKDVKVTGEQYNHSRNHVIGNFLGFNLTKTGPARGKQTYNGSEELHLTSKPLAARSLHIACGGDSGTSHNKVSPSSEKHNQVTYHGEDFPLMINISSSSSKIYEKLKQNTGQACALESMNTSSSSAGKGYICVEEKGNGKPGSDPKSSVNMMFNDKSSFSENLWITRFLRKVSSPILSSVKCNLSMDDNGALNKEQNFPENHVSSYLNSQRESAGEVKKHSVNPTFPCGLKRLDDQMLKPRLSSIIPSENFKKTELEASCSARRFDLSPSKVSHNHNLSCTPITCLLCGKDGHSLRECSEMAESDLQDFKKFMDSHDGKDISSCFYMRCVQANHWEISCPCTSLKIKNTRNISFSGAHESCNMKEEKLDNHSVSDHAEKINLLSLDKNKQHVNKCKLPESGDSRMDDQNVIQKSTYVDRIASPTADGFKDYQGESMVNMKQKASSSSENESGGNQIIPFYKCIATDVTNEQNGIFKAVRRLRLSRTNVIRWMKSSSVRYSLEGFFLRLRLGNWDKGLGGTGYQVARIISASRENWLSVSIGHLKCSIECCFVSNHDYIEEELKAWLSATLEADGKMPSIEELNKKLGEREELGF